MDKVLSQITLWHLNLIGFCSFTQLYDRRTRSLKYEAEKKAWRSINPHYMSDEESDGEDAFIVHSPFWRSQRKFKQMCSWLISYRDSNTIVTLLHAFIFQNFRTWCKSWTPDSSGTTMVPDRASVPSHARVVITAWNHHSRQSRNGLSPQKPWPQWLKQWPWHSQSRDLRKKTLLNCKVLTFQSNNNVQFCLSHNSYTHYPSLFYCNSPRISICINIIVESKSSRLHFGHFLRRLYIVRVYVPVPNQNTEAGAHL